MASSTNTWEPLQNLKCPLLLQQFSNDKHNYLSQVKKGKAVTLKENHRPWLFVLNTLWEIQQDGPAEMAGWTQQRKTHKDDFVENTVDLERGLQTSTTLMNTSQLWNQLSKWSYLWLFMHRLLLWKMLSCWSWSSFVAYNKNQQVKST